MADHADRRERRITAAIVALALCGVAGLVTSAALLTKSPDQVPYVGKATPSPQPTTTMEPVKPSAEAVTPAPAPTGDHLAATWLTRVSRRTGIGTIALEAYGLAAVHLAHEQPRCRVGWTTLAGIGAIESGHGTTGGSRVRSDGTTSRRILGPALDGSAGMARIRSDAQSAGWHGDNRWDHAMGPMQFIPSTWRRWASDGNDDGVDDPHNIVDAAYSAGRYLCASGTDLTTSTGWTQAIFSYNHSEDYVRSVLARANSYARP